MGDKPQSTKAKSKSNGASHSGMYDLGALMKEAKTLQQFETTGKKPKKSKKIKQQQQLRPDTVDGSVNFRERSQSVSHIDVETSGRGGGRSGTFVALTFLHVRITSTNCSLSRSSEF